MNPFVNPKKRSVLLPADCKNLADALGHPKLAAISLNLGQLEPLVGRYELSPEFVLTVSAAGGKLFVQATGQPKSEVFPESESNFF